MSIQPLDSSIDITVAPTVDDFDFQDGWRVSVRPGVL